MIGAVRVTVVVGAVLLSAGSVAAAAAPYASAVYCIATRRAPGLKAFAYRALPEGDLEFSVTHWYEDGQNVGASGVAHPRAGDWVFEDKMDSQDPEEPCRLTITLRPDGSAALHADDKAHCGTKGGAGTDMADLEFPKATREGPLPKGFQLLDHDSFPTRCDAHQLPSRQ